MKIYTKTGDQGETQVYLTDTLRKRKDDLLLEAYGTLDELNAHVGVLISHVNNTDKALIEQLTLVQRDLFQLGFAISASSTLDETRIVALENAIDAMQKSVPAQTAFILPGGTLQAAQAHVCRTVCRRAERVLVSLAEQHELAPVAQAYINRLSDYFFVLARYFNYHAEVSDIEV
ncbi:cob(I)yrinic acid a,c-diamide adenosyltransferase [Alteromonas sp. ASW11-36]|uniref:Corrinoid adenosyltransferase n=1 Tax=Alteromonas arenosi TaxID=3055817 RepID=A0ABT7SY30_9ALTE|nr:cob(I)yrinic acid a,c-diamide adenosyltransferase [Alteromonas sp. ASW11-36]MDM7861103.1 cob(I)yrinic acid a,c-diamide adenosyltransferase [Alteromonas sp. ASW11-36]